MKRMKHPNHGFHHAYNTHEEARMRAAGWVDDDAEEVKVELPVSEVQEETVDSLRAQLEKAGVDFDRRWGLEKLRNALRGEQ